MPAAAGPVFVRGSRAPLVAKPWQRVDAAGALRAARTQIREPSDQFCLIPTAQFVFPNTNHGPVAFAQSAVDAAVAGLVASDLVAPELRVGLGLGRVLRATVLEAAIHKHGGLALGLRVRQLFRSGEFYTSIGCIEGLVWRVD